MLSVSLSHLLDRGVRLECGEAVAIAQLLLETPGVPAIDNVELRSDGSAAYLGTGGSATVRDIAAFLQQLLPPEVRVPGALRYAIARGLGGVDAPPFASRTEFSAVLRRFEACERGTIVRALLARASRIAPALVPAEGLEKPLEAAVLRPLVIPPVPSALPPPVVPAAEADPEPAARVPLVRLTHVEPAAAATPGRVSRRTGWQAAAVAAGLVASALGGSTVAPWRKRADMKKAAPPTTVSEPASRSAGAPSTSHGTGVPTATTGHV